MKGSILVVDDELTTSKLIGAILRGERYSVDVADSAEAALVRLRDKTYDVMLLDINMSGISGQKLLSILKEDPRTQSLPVIMVTSKSEETSKIRALEGGADDYLVKPFAHRELLARVAALLRRVQRGGQVENRLERSGIAMDFDRHCVAVDGREISLTRTEFELLATLMRRGGSVATYRELEDTLAKDARLMTSANLYVQVNTLRKKLGGKASCVETVHGLGYKFNG